MRLKTEATINTALSELFRLKNRTVIAYLSIPIK